MMMQALEAGGLEAAFNSQRNQMNETYGDEVYKPNPGGFYELNRQEYTVPGFPRGYEGKLIKHLHGGISRIVAGNYKIVFMRRDLEEVRQSYEAFFDANLHVDMGELNQRIEDSLGILRVRSDVEVEEVWYRDVVENPIDVFSALKERGWPIDPEKAALIVNPELCRFKKERLEVGI